MNSPSFPAATHRMFWPTRMHAVLVFMACCAWLGLFAGLRPLSLPDEGRYVGVAWEMLQSHDWLRPTLDGLPFFHKPPLFYWLAAFALDLFGPNAWAARIVSVLAASLSVTILHSTLRDRMGESAAGLAALVLATQPLFFGAAQYANLDMLVAACITASILFGARAALSLEASLPYRADLAGAYAAVALGVLAKGLIGLVIPALVLLVWLGMARRWRTMRRLCWAPGFAIVVVIAMPWFVAVQWKYPDFFRYFFVVQQFDRFTSTGFNNVQPLWFYLPVLLVLMLPWSGWLFLRLHSSSWREWVQARRLNLTSLMWVWLGVVLIFFSIPQSKLIGYILPALPPLAVLIAATAHPALKASSTARRLWAWSAGTAVCLCVAAVVAVSLARPKSSRDLAAQLATHRLAHDGVAFIDDYRYDVPFYLQGTDPIVVVSNWDPIEIRKHDNWRKELADAGGFAPNLAVDRLVDDARFRSMLCEGRVKWVIADSDRASRYAFLTAAPVVATEENRRLWHTDISDPHFSNAVDCSAAALQYARSR